MNADTLVKVLFGLQEMIDPDSDPGDLTIGVQDDYPLVEVAQRGRGTIGRGRTIDEALKNAIVGTAHRIKIEEE